MNNLITTDSHKVESQKETQFHPNEITLTKNIRVLCGDKEFTFKAVVVKINEHYRYIVNVNLTAQGLTDEWQRRMVMSINDSEDFAMYAIILKNKPRTINLKNTLIAKYYNVDEISVDIIVEEN